MGFFCFFFVFVFSRFLENLRMAQGPLFVSSFAWEGGEDFSSPEPPTTTTTTTGIIGELKQLDTSLHYGFSAYEQRDLHTELGVDLEILRQLGMRIGEWAIISTHPTISNQPVQDLPFCFPPSSRLVRLYPLPSSSSPSLFFSSPSLFLSLSLSAGYQQTTKQIPLLVRRLFCSLPPLSSFSQNPSSFSSPEGDYSISLASSLSLSLIPSPTTFSTPSSSLTTLLRSHFTTPRVLSPGDIICIKFPFSVGKHASFLFEREEEEGEEGMVVGEGFGGEGEEGGDVTDVVFGHRHFKYVYFFVQSMKGEGEEGGEGGKFFVVDSKITSIVQKGVKRTFIPRKMENFLENCSCDTSLPTLDDGSTPAHTQPPGMCRRVGLVGGKGGEGVWCPSLVGFPSVWSEEEEPLSELIRISEVFFHPLSRSLFPHPSPILLSGPAGVGKAHLVKHLTHHLNVHFLEIRCGELVDQNTKKIQQNLRAVGRMAKESGPCVLLLRGIDVLEKPHKITQAGNGERETPNPLSDCLRSTLRLLSSPPPRSPPSSSSPTPSVLLIATTSDTALTEMSPDVRSFFPFEVVVPAPDAGVRRKILEYLMASLPVGEGVDLKKVSNETASFSSVHLSALVRGAWDLSVEKMFNGQKGGEKGSSPVSLKITGEEIQDSLDSVRKMQSKEAAGKGVSGTASIPTVKWDDVGGLRDAKQEIIDTIQLPLNHPHLFASGMKRRSGILLYGPPGTGKTLLAKAVATECSLNFMSVKGPELVNMYIGQSEKNIRDVFARARAAKPCVIFFDELDSLAPNRGKSGDSGGVMDRVVSQLLGEVDGLDQGNDVFVIGATNRPDLLDPALLRPGRFDRLVYLGVCDTRDAQVQIVKAVTRKYRVGAEVKLEDVAELCPFTFTGADLQAVCSDALRLAIRERLEEVEQEEKEGICESDKKKEKIEILFKHFREAVEGVTPSVSEADLEYYQSVKEKYTKKE